MSQIERNSAKISWPASAEPADEYEIEYTDSKGVKKTEIVPSTSLIITQLSPGETYNVTVSAIKNGIKSGKSPVTTFTTKDIGEENSLFYINFEAILLSNGHT